jgi:hypothetical protein
MHHCSRLAAIALLTVLGFVSGRVSLGATGEGTGALRGQVVDGAGLPIASATVLVGESEFEATTGAEGHYEIVGLPAGRYTVEARCGGFGIETVEQVAVAEGEAVALDFQLVALEVRLREIVVTSSVEILREVPSAGVSLDRQEIMRLPHFGDDPYRAVAVLPGASGGDISGRFNVRGGFHDELLVRLDEMELYEPFHLKDFQGVFSVLDPEMIENELSEPFRPFAQAILEGRRQRAPALPVPADAQGPQAGAGGLGQTALRLSPAQRRPGIRLDLFPWNRRFHHDVRGGQFAHGDPGR